MNSASIGPFAVCIHAVAYIVLLSAGLRLFRLAEPNLWYGKAFDVRNSLAGLSDLFARTRRDTIPALEVNIGEIGAYLPSGSCETP